MSPTGRAVSFPAMSTGSRWMTVYGHFMKHGSTGIYAKDAMKVNSMYGLKDRIRIINYACPKGRAMA
jgi:hypothetical protein